MMGKGSFIIIVNVRLNGSKGHSNFRRWTSSAISFKNLARVSVLNVIRASTETTAWNEQKTKRRRALLNACSLICCQDNTAKAYWIRDFGSSIVFPLYQVPCLAFSSSIFIFLKPNTFHCKEDIGKVPKVFLAPKLCRTMVEMYRYSWFYWINTVNAWIE